MRHLIALAILILTAQAQADTTLSAVGVLSKGLGYEDNGFGLQLDHDGRQGAWGWDIQATALRHAKRHAEGNRYQAIAMGRRYFGTTFIESGIEYGGYKSDFPDGTTWTKYGYSPGVGIGTTQGGTEFSLRYFMPDSTPNETSVIAVSGEIPVGDWRLGATVERWGFDQGGERLSGNQVTVEFGWRF